jgi:hypothetical protein
VAALLPCGLPVTLLEKENAIIELSPEQVQAIEQGELLPVVVNPKTREEFVLLPKKRYEAMQKWIAPLKRRWDDPAADDLVEQPHEAR